MIIGALKKESKYYKTYKKAVAKNNMYYSNPNPNKFFSEASIYALDVSFTNVDNDIYSYMSRVILNELAHNLAIKTTAK